MGLARGIAFSLLPPTPPPAPPVHPPTHRRLSGHSRGLSLCDPFSTSDIAVGLWVIHEQADP